MTRMKMKPESVDTTAVTAINGFVISIRSSDPTSIVMEDTNMAIAWFSDIWIVSTSFVTRLRISPNVVVS